MTLQTSHSHYNILSLDGGGVRGLIAAKVLQELESRSHKPISCLFDLVVGTSTGGIIAIALNLYEDGVPKFSAKDLVDLYRNDCNSIFHYSTVHDIKTAKGLLGPKYDRSYLDKVLDDYLGEARLSDLQNSVCVTSYSIIETKPHLWCSYHAKQSSSWDFLLKDLAGATSAAPTYFAPKTFKGSDGTLYSEIDGGIFLNTPESMAILAAHRQNPTLSEKDFFLLSIGTGGVKLNLPIEELQDAGIIKWLTAGKLIDLMIDAASDYSSLHAGTSCENRVRIQVDLPSDLGGMDNCDSENLDGLLWAVDQYIFEHSETFDYLIETLQRDCNNFFPHDLCWT